jgi:hypothetical protein
MGASKEYVEDLLEQQRRARLEAANRQQYDHDESAQIFGVSAVTKLPSEVVAADLPNLLKQVKADEFNYDDYTDQINGAPAFNRFVSENPYHLSVLERDHKNLPSLERAYRQMSLGWQSGWAMTEIAEIRDRQMVNFEDPDNEQDRERLKQLSQLVEGGMFGADAWYSKVLVGTAQQVPIQAWLIGESLDEAAIGAGAGLAIGAVTGAGAIATSLSGAGRGFMVGRTEAAFRLERGLAYDEYIGLGLNEEEARWAASAVGGVNAALESIGLGALTKRIPGFRNIQNDAVGAMINKVLSKPTMRQAIGRATLMYGEGVATELVTEVMQEVTLMMGKELLRSHAREAGDLRPETEAMNSDEFWDQIGDIAAHTLYGVALIGGIGPSANLIRDSGRAWKADKYGVALDVLGDAAENSETRKSAPTKYEEFVRNLAGDGKKILIEARRFIDYFQEQGMDADEVARSIGITDLGEAEISGMDIEIPADQYLAKIAPTPHHKGLKADIREGPDAMSQNEAQIYRENASQILNEIQELAAKQDPKQAAEDAALTEDIKARLIETGTSPEAAEHQSKFMVGIANLARRAGKDVNQFYHERFGGIVATTNAQMRADKEDFDPFVDPLINRVRANDMPLQRDILGPSLIDRMKALGGLAPDPELDARDIKKQVRDLIREGGLTLDGIAETLAEEGYIVERDPEKVIEALEREISGDAVFSRTHAINTEEQELLGQLEQLAHFIEEAGIELDNMTNAEVRAALAEMDTFYQTDKDLDVNSLAGLTQLALESATHDPSLMAKLAARIPAIAEEQDFGDVRFTDTLTLAGGKEVLHTRAANSDFRRAKKRSNVLQKLKDCLGG